MILKNKSAQSSGLTWFFALIIIVLILVLFVVSITGLFIAKGFAGKGNILGTKTTVLSADSFFLNGLQGQRMLFYFLNSPIRLYSDTSFLEFIQLNDINTGDESIRQKIYSDSSVLFMRLNSGEKTPFYLISNRFGAGVLNCDQSPRNMVQDDVRLDKFIFGEAQYNIARMPYYFSPGQNLFGYGLGFSLPNNRLNFGLYYKNEICEKTLLEKVGIA